MPENEVLSGRSNSMFASSSAASKAFLHEVMVKHPLPTTREEEAQELLDRMRRNISIDRLQPPAPAPSLLDCAIDTITSKVISDEETRREVNHCGAELLKTASLFAHGKYGLVSAALLHGLAQAHTDDGMVGGSFNLALGGTKGVAMQKLFSHTSQNIKFAPAKGVAMGMINRSADIVFSRNTFVNPAQTIEHLKAVNLNPSLWVLDGTTFAVSEGLFGAANRLSCNRLLQNRMASAMGMGTSFGIVNGGSSEILRQQEKGEPLNYERILERSLLEGMVGMAGAGLGTKLSDPGFYSGLRYRYENMDVTADRLMRSAGLKSQAGRRDFVITGDRTGLEKLANNQVSEASTSVRELKRFLFLTRKGPEQELHVTHDAKPKPGMKLVPGKSLLATCHAERLSSQDRAFHAFPESEGPIWMDLGGSGRMRLLSENTYKADPGTYKPLGKLVKLSRPEITVNVMAPLAVGNVMDPNDPAAREAWDVFDRDLANAKKQGVDSVSTDVWWGLIEPKPGTFNWNYYDRLSQRISDHGLKWVPILAFHQCGGNVGDNVYVPIPFWIWNHVAGRAGSSNPDVGKYVSEQGNASSEYVSAWATKFALPRYRNVMEQFQSHFAGSRNNISEINVSMGPAGEIRYPSYNAHDKNSGYPTRGALQCYSELAIKSFQDFAVLKYGDQSKVKEAWGSEFGEGIHPPRNVDQFFSQGKHHNTQYGKDFFDWYNQSLLDHGSQVLGTAMDVFGSKGSPFSGIDIGGKMPGIHWRVGAKAGNDIVVSDRLAELNAGLIRTSGNDWNSDALGRGYRPILQMFKNAQRADSQSKVVPHFTALEMADGQEGPSVQSLPYTLATWVGQEAGRNGLNLKGENALSWNLSDDNSWHRMRSHLNLPGPGQTGYYNGLTFLRMSDVVNNETARWHLSQMMEAIRAARAPEAEAK